MESPSRPAKPPAVDTLPRPFGAQPDAFDPTALEPTPNPEDTLSRRASVLPVVPADEAPMTRESFDSPNDAELMDAEPIDDDEIAAELPMATEDPARTSDDPVWGDDPFPPDEADTAAPVSADTLSPAMREELRDTLEKIAWDAFGQVTEKVVREAIERIERAAWEVVPKLAETLIQEEIRRLKGGNDAE
jgi:hypothetical protein